MARWLILIYQLPTEPSAPRVAVWRALKRLPGTYLQDGVFVVRASSLRMLALAELAHDVRNYGGRAVLVTSSHIDGEADLAVALAAAREGAPRRVTPIVSIRRVGVRARGRGKDVKPSR